MKKATLFGLILGVSLAGFAVSLYVISVAYQSRYGNNYMYDMMSRMMGGRGGMGLPEPIETPVYLWALPPVFIGTLVIGVVGLVYYLVIPEIRVQSQEVRRGEGALVSPLKSEKISMLLNTLKPDEKRVFEVLASHGGKYLQKHISKEAELSRLKTHRIIARFAERGIVAVRPFGNTNEVAFSDWLLSEESNKKREGEEKPS